MNDELKYLDYFGLEYNPFPVAPDHEKFFLSEHIDLMISEIVHGVLTRKGFMVLTGEVGLGKTTIGRKIVGILEEKNVETSLVLHTLYQDVELLREINRDFGLVSDSLNLSDQMNLLRDFLVDKNRNGKNCAIIIDDAQNLSLNNLELIRMISNLETDREKLVQILLVGQPELIAKLDSPELRQLKSRIIIMAEAQPLILSELKNYILFKLNMAGNRGKTDVTNRAFRRIYGYSQGNFRKINILMDRCLYVAFLHDTTNIDKSVVNTALKDMRFDEQTGWKGARYALSAVMILILLISGGILYIKLTPQVDHLNIKRFFYKQTAASTENQTIDKAVLSEKTPVSDLSDKPALNEKPFVPAALSQFLAYYNLLDYESKFFMAMRINRFKDIADSIYEETGYQLIQLDHLTENIRNNHAVFSFTSKKTGKEIYFILWKPIIRITRFYPGYNGEEIRKLEELLGAIKLYTYYLDGTVGSRLMKAVSRFQGEKDLEITGFPDQTTIFLLCNGG